MNLLTLVMYIRVRHYSLRTEDAYIQWIKRFILFYNKRHPGEMGEAEIKAFLTYLALDKKYCDSYTESCTCCHLISLHSP
ncbi:MAG: phage integrase N-terminal SAM-like domain-containing protein [Nitrosomonas sp.]|nr:phage integrase N-terminal SAM-like domain-containing protein [Nitrosomonas sp.]